MRVGRNDEVGMIPSPGNPYRDYSDQMVGPRVELEPAVVTLRDLDRLVAAKLEDARCEWARDQRRECERAWEEGRYAGLREGRQNIVEWLRVNVIARVDTAETCLRDVRKGFDVLAPDDLDKEVKANVPRAEGLLTRAISTFAEVEARDD
jgi:hypothetical protein